ncbi:dolichyldiphosphatase 1 [Elysia marginata]|uniref:Dolichyldiphosphatase n=1 Tax=Elysia marginata TaxID=1093978 RepID=A0AAV4GWG3_9GAST|nr:dolichyldiphosphatase 1 [Elysia marginata]
MAEDVVKMHGQEFDTVEWKAVSFTYVEYPKGDFLGFLLAWISLLPMIILVSFATLIIFRRDLHTIAFATGLVVNEAANWIFKHCFKEARPMRGRQNLHTEYGMPSSHSQFMWFFSSYFTVFLLLRLYRNQSIVDDLWKYVCALLSLVAAVLVSWSRVYLMYHTVSQVAVGAVVGSLLSAPWFYLVHVLLTPVFPIISNSPLGELLMLRDSTLIPHVLWFEYTCSRSEARYGFLVLFKFF